MSTTEEQINDSTAYFDWLEKAISENYIKYYDYVKFNNREEICSGSFGNVSRANWKDTVMVLKYSYNLTIKEIVNEVNYYKYCNIYTYIYTYINLFKI